MDQILLRDDRGLPKLSDLMGALAREVEAETETAWETGSDAPPPDHETCDHPDDSSLPGEVDDAAVGEPHAEDGEHGGLAFDEPVEEGEEAWLAPAATDEPPAAARDPGDPAPRLSKVMMKRLPNATVGRELEVDLLASLHTVDFPFGGVTPCDGLPPGLTCEQSVLRGRPETAGEWEFDVECELAEPQPGHPSSLHRRLVLTVNPDPRSLWRNIDSDRNLPYWKEDRVAVCLDVSPAMVIGASSRGRSHAHVGSCRDDDMAMGWIPETDWYVLTVADGAGSATYSREGSRIACQQVNAYLEQCLKSEGVTECLLASLAASESGAWGEATPQTRSLLYSLFGEAALSARKAIERAAALASAQTRDFHTTLITVLAHPLGEKGWLVAAFSIGDGAAGMIGIGEGAPSLLTKPDAGEYAGQTVFLTMPEVLSTSYESIYARISAWVVSRLDALILMTDGVTDPRFDSETRLADPACWQGVWEDVQAELTSASSREEASHAVLKWMDFHSPGHHDDRTLVLLSPSLFPTHS